MQEPDPLGQMNFPLIRSLARMSGVFQRAGWLALAMFVVALLAFRDAPAQGAIAAGSFVILLFGFSYALQALARSRFTDL